MHQLRHSNSILSRQLPNGCMHACIHSFMHACTHGFVHSFMQACTHASFILSCMHSLIMFHLYPFIRSFVHSFVCSFVRLSVRSFVCPFVRLLVVCMHALINTFVNSLSRADASSTYDYIRFMSLFLKVYLLPHIRDISNVSNALCFSFSIRTPWPMRTRELDLFVCLQSGVWFCCPKPYVNTNC